MLAEYKKKTNIGVGFGVPAYLAGGILFYQENTAGLMFIIIGTIFLIWGCSNYTKGKGYSSAWGILGIVGLIGYIILACLRDRRPSK